MGPATSNRQQVCAQEVSITQADVTIVSAPTGANIHMEIPGVFFDLSDAGVQMFPPVPGGLVAGQTYTLPAGYNGYGYVDLGRCLDVVGSAGLVYKITAYPVVDLSVLLSYSLGGAYPGHPPSAGRAWRGHLPYPPP